MRYPSSLRALTMTAAVTAAAIGCGEKTAELEPRPTVTESTADENCTNSTLKNEKFTNNNISVLAPSENSPLQFAYAIYQSGPSTLTIDQHEYTLSTKDIGARTRSLGILSLNANIPFTIHDPQATLRLTPNPTDAVVNVQTCRKN